MGYHNLNLAFVLFFFKESYFYFYCFSNSNVTSSPIRIKGAQLETLAKPLLLIHFIPDKEIHWHSPHEQGQHGIYLYHAIDDQFFLIFTDVTDREAGYAKTNSLEFAIAQYEISH